MRRMRPSASTAAEGYNGIVKVENFEQAVRDFVKRQPFKPFVIELVSRRLLYIDHPEGVITRQGQAAHLAADGRPSLFDNEGVVRLYYASPEEAKKSSA